MRYSFLLLLRIPCKAGICSSPLEVTACHLIATAKWPAVVVKALLYPGAVLHAAHKSQVIPGFNNLLTNTYNLWDFDDSVDIQRIEVLVGSIFCVAGALLSLRAGRIALIGSSLIVWGLFREAMLELHAKRPIVVENYPISFLATLLAFFSIKSDVRQLIRSFKPRRHRKEKHN
ncbi:hypothetical protein Acr_23g0002190 [Actinidia rufa]|uniref:Uncharacterized protein n=1 Tax=Actinidia rufa TaxID=165716 RepID=A0A7J0GMD5_9ERIC|nr:hypothetical protein Acr_23g0002190 [Actinidia rufa]